MIIYDIAGEQPGVRPAVAEPQGRCSPRTSRSASSALAHLAGNYGKVFDEIAAVKQTCGDTRLKVILETGELATYDNVRRASWLALLAGGDFIKTSTGKVAPAATLPVIHVMLQAVHDWRKATGELRAGQAGRRHPEHQGRDPLSRRRARGGWTGVVGPLSVPVRGLLPAQ